MNASRAERAPQGGNCLCIAPLIPSQGCSVVSAKAGFCILSQSNYPETTQPNPQPCAIFGAELPAPRVAVPRMASSAREQALLAGRGILIKQGEKWGLAAGQMP